MLLYVIKPKPISKFDNHHFKVTSHVYYNKVLQKNSNAERYYCVALYLDNHF